MIPDFSICQLWYSLFPISKLLFIIHRLENDFYFLLGLKRPRKHLFIEKTCNLINLTCHLPYGCFQDWFCILKLLTKFSNSLFDLMDLTLILPFWLCFCFEPTSLAIPDTEKSDKVILLASEIMSNMLNTLEAIRKLFLNELRVKKERANVKKVRVNK